MSEYMSVTTLEEVALLDKDEIMAGYWHGIYGGIEPGSDKSKSFHHGWRNGYSDGGYAPLDDAQRLLIKAYEPRCERMLH